MKKTAPPLHPALQRQLSALGARLRLARERRKLPSELFAERVGISRETLRRLEKGEATIAMGTFLRALRVLGLDADINCLAEDDVLGRNLQDMDVSGKRFRDPVVRKGPSA